MIIRLKLTAGNVNLGDVDVTFPGKEVSSSDPARRADTTMTLDVLALDDGALLEIAETAACDLRDKMQYSRGEYEEDPDEEGERDMDDDKTTIRRS